MQTAGKAKCVMNAAGRRFRVAAAPSIQQIPFSFSPQFLFLRPVHFNFVCALLLRRLSTPLPFQPLGGKGREGRGRGRRNHGNLAVFALPFPLCKEKRKRNTARFPPNSRKIQHTQRRAFNPSLPPHYVTRPLLSLSTCLLILYTWPRIGSC